MKVAPPGGFFTFMGVAGGIFHRYLIKPQNGRHSNDCYVQVKCFYDGCVVGGVALSDPA